MMQKYVFRETMKTTILVVSEGVKSYDYRSYERNRKLPTDLLYTPEISALGKETLTEAAWNFGWDGRVRCQYPHQQV